MGQALYPFISLVLLYSAIADLRFREIPNWAPGLIGLAGIVSHLYTHHLDWLMLGVLIGAIALIPWWFNRLGGGDAKLIIALGAAIGPLISPLMILSLCLAAIARGWQLWTSKNSAGLPLAPYILLGFLLQWGALYYLFYRY